MRSLDLTSWQSLLSTLLAIALVTVIGVGVRMLAMSTIQQRRERANRQINERLRVLIAAYKTLGGSFTGDLTVDPAHLRDLRLRPDPEQPTGADGIESGKLSDGSDRSRRMRDAVETALADIILLGTDQQVQLAAAAARELVAGRRVPTHELVVSLRTFIRSALDLEPVSSWLEIPPQGPARPGGSGSGDRGKNKDAGGGGRRGGGGSGGGGAVGLGVGGVAAAGMPSGDGYPEAEKPPESGV